MVPLFLNNACPEGSLDILYHKPACRYKMGDEIRVAILIANRAAIQVSLEILISFILRQMQGIGFSK